MQQRLNTKNKSVEHEAVLDEQKLRLEREPDMIKVRHNCRATIWHAKNVDGIYPFSNENSHKL